MLYGEGHKFISALLWLGRPAAEAWAAEHRSDSSLEQLAGQSEIRAAAGAMVQKVNANLSRSEQIKEWVLLGSELTVAGGELTPTLKLRRKDVAARYGHLLEHFYHVAAAR
jgi:long-chain acyl-CoA synthetase